MKKILIGLLILTASLFAQVTIENGDFFGKKATPVSVQNKDKKIVTYIYNKGNQNIEKKSDKWKFGTC